ncbi:MAG: hypothetical protein OEZ48_00185 [Candidatus Bathyarchaeota archaeon]|nr:hypothetical protein [Candidatus Bathyarchaeota archaeon]
MNKNVGAIVGVLMIASLLLGTFLVGSVVKMGTVGFITGYQGLQAEFNSVYLKGYWYDSDHDGPNKNYLEWPDKRASAVEFFDHINLDPDHSSDLLPNLAASMSPIVVDETVDPKRWIWRVKVGEETEEGKNATHSWFRIIEEYKEFQILRYRCEWAMNLWLSGPGTEAYPDDLRTYRDAQVWIRLVPQAFVYFEDNPDQVYFSPALVQVLDVEWYSFTDDKEKEVKDEAIAKYEDLIPKSEGETLGIFYSRGAQEINLQNKVLSYENQLLDPAVFRDEYWIRLSLLEFKPNSWWNDPLHLTGWSWQYPSVKIKFLVHVFVVGEWTVKLEKGETVELEVHDPTVSPPAAPWFDISHITDALEAFWADPLNKLATGLFVLMVAIVIILVFTPIGTAVGAAIVKKVTG